MMIRLSVRIFLALGLSVWLNPVPILADTPGAAEPSTPASEYGKGVRSTAWLSPEQERAGFHLPPGFKVRLFASEPQIAKPLNMAFDARGSLWITQSVEYPYPAENDSDASDAVQVLSDTDGDGTADSIVTFADKLNIPMGILPYGDGCLCFSIPNILYLRDTDGDGKCDQREVVLGPFDTTRDTHGMINAMRDGGDGWIYACHGFNNQSVVSGSDGHQVKLSSGNTFRFRPDGSRVEVITHGQVNPFGMTEDDWGYRYSADCHSKPISQLIRDACYPSFGRPHDGLGFLPPMIDHLHGSTAICGLVYLPANSAIKPLRDQMISGNVMTSRLNRNALSFVGATAKGKELSDFMTSDDPWFRPVDIQLGPDGHLYVADFYNKIIGHYEVPLTHPDRDRTSGRIWQIRYLANEAESADVATIGDDLRSTNPTRRQWASRSVDLNIARQVASSAAESSRARVAAMRSLGVTNAWDPADLASLCVSEDPRVRVEALHLGSEFSGDTGPLHEGAIRSLSNSNPHVVRAAAEFLGLRGNDDDIDALFDTLASVDPADQVLRQTIRIALRNLYQQSPSDSMAWQRIVDAEFVSIMLGLRRPEMVDALLSYLSDHPDASNRDELLQHAAENADDTTLAKCVAVAKKLADDKAIQFQLLRVLADSQNARRGNVPRAIGDWASEMVDAELQQFEQRSGGKRVVSWSTRDGDRWPARERKLADGTSAWLVDSIGLGESYIGSLRSDPFAAPEEIRFLLAGHNGSPKEVDHRKNKVRLIDTVTGEVIKEAFPPRNDVAVIINWDTSDLGGRQVRIECIDQDSSSAYAWLAIGRFQPAWIQGFEQDDALRRATEWIERLGLESKEPRLLGYLQSDKLSQRLRLDIAGAIASLRRQREATVLLNFMSRTDVGSELIHRAIAATLNNEAAEISESTKLLAKQLSSSGQREFALAWVNGGASGERLLQMCQDGWISATSLADVDVRQSLTPSLSPSLLERLHELTANVDNVASQQKLLERIGDAVAMRDGNRENGHRVFTKHCAACHQLRGEGTVVGPQLDGAVTRSVKRLLEDIVTPDQNIDKAFRTTSFLLDDGRVMIGLLQAETETEITLVDSTGKVVKVDPSTIEQRRDAGRSLMPSNLGEVLSNEEIADLLDFMR